LEGGWEASGGLELERDSTLYGYYVALRSFEHWFGFGWTLPTTLTEPSTVHHRILPSYGALCTFGDISTPLYALIRVLPLQRRLSGCRATLARRCIVGHDGLVQGRWIAFPLLSSRLFCSLQQLRGRRQLGLEDGGGGHRRRRLLGFGEDTRDIDLCW